MTCQTLVLKPPKSLKLQMSPMLIKLMSTYGFLDRTPYSSKEEHSRLCKKPVLSPSHQFSQFMKRIYKEQMLTSNVLKTSMKPVSKAKLMLNNERKTFVSSWNNSWNHMSA